MLNNILRNETNLTLTENSGTAYRSSESFCLDMFFKAGAMRTASERDISNTVTRAFCEDPDKTMKILFFARDVRGGLGERRFFRCAVETLIGFAPDAVRKNIPLFSEYGRWDDLLVLIDTPLEGDAVKVINERLSEDLRAMEQGKPVSLLAKWLPSVNASSRETCRQGRRMAALLGMSEKTYRKTLSALRRYTDIVENRLRERDYTFKYESQPSCAMLKYRAAFIRNDGERYHNYMNSVARGEAKLNTSTLYPYDVVRNAMDRDLSEKERESLDITWKALSAMTAENRENALAVVDGSGSMYGRYGGSLRPIDAALSLGIFFAEHNKGMFENCFMTFSMNPQIVSIKGRDICEKVRYCESFDEIANTDLEAVFLVLLRAAAANKAKPEEMPSRLYIISDMQFDYCVVGGNDEPLFREMKKLYNKHGYKLPEIVFWNVSSRSDAIPVNRSETGAALVSGYTAAVFNMVMSGEISPETVMNDILSSERYADITAA